MASDLALYDCNFSPLTHYNPRNIPKCFHSLETKVKEKILISFLDLTTTAGMREILEIGCHDQHEGIRNLSEVLKYYSSKGMLYVNHDEVSPEFAEVTQEVKKTSKQLSPVIIIIIIYYI